MKKLFVRIGQKAGPETFYRCGMEFARAWQQVEVDNATADRLQSEQMLEVSEDQPEDYVPLGDPESATLKSKAEAEEVKAQALAAAKAPAKKK